MIWSEIILRHLPDGTRILGATHVREHAENEFQAVECSRPRNVYSAIRRGAERFHGSYRSLNDGKPFSGLMPIFEPLYLEPLITRWPKALHFSRAGA